LTIHLSTFRQGRKRRNDLVILHEAKQRKHEKMNTRETNRSQKNSELDPKENTYLRESMAGTVWLHATG
jgi:hypothetical protein